MRNNILVTSALTATVIMFVVDCSSNQSIKTTDGKTTVTSGKPQVDDDTGFVSYKNAEIDRVEQINRDQVKFTDELDNRWLSQVPRGVCGAERARYSSA